MKNTLKKVCSYQNRLYICISNKAKNNLKNKKMNTQEIYKLANEITEQQVENVYAGWVAKNENEKLNTYNSLVRLGDSKQLACATVMINQPINKETKDFYRMAYEN